MNTVIGGLARSMKRKSVEAHKELQARGEVVKWDGKTGCSRCGLVIDAPLDLAY